MSTKRKREENLPADYSDLLQKPLSAILDAASVKFAAHGLMAKRNPTSRDLYQIQIAVGFFNPQYRDMAPLVRLDHNRNLEDIATFDLHRSRIPTSLFRSIVEDMDILMLQYGPPCDHETEKATSRLFAPIFNHLVAQFSSAFRNLLEYSHDGSTTTQGTIKHHFRAFGSISTLFIEIWLEVHTPKTEMGAIAQVIAQCEACYYENIQCGLRVPVFVILWDGAVFRFFLFDGSTEPYSFSRGTLPGNPPLVWYGFKFDNFTRTGNTWPFNCDLRQICEIIFDLLLQSHISSLTAYLEDFADKVKEGVKPEKSADVWKDALRFAHVALDVFRDAESMHQKNFAAETNAAVQHAMESLKRSINKAPIIQKIDSIMSSWDDDEVESI